jgi:hypothetical protein
VESITIVKNPNTPAFVVDLKGIGQNQIIDKGTEALGALSISLTDTPAAPLLQGATYSFTVKIVVTQWTHRGVVMTVSTSSLPRGEVGVQYSQTLATKGGTAPYTWTKTAGSLPSGIGLSASGVISGTPTAAGTYNFTVQVVDSSSPVQTATANLSITVNPAPTIITNSLPNGKKDKSYSQTLAATGGTSHYTWAIAVGSLPAGLTLNTSTGAISGKPTVTGNFNFTVQVKDSVGGTAMKTLTIKVNP